MGEGLIVRRGGKKSGKYVWKKLTKPIMVTFVQTSYNPIKFTVSSGDIDFGSVDESWFVGIKCSYSWATAVYAFEFMENNVFVIWTADGKSHLYEGTYSYNPSNKTITTDINTPGSFGINSSATKQGNFLDFVVSDDPIAYPDGAEQDGYWYEKFQLDPALFGCTKYSVDKITFSADTNASNLAINHSLGEIPHFAIITAANNDIDFSTSNYVVSIHDRIGYNGKTRISGSGYSHGSIDVTTTTSDRYLESYGYGFSGWNADRLTITSKINPYSLRFKAGIEYTLITMA